MMDALIMGEVDLKDIEVDEDMMTITVEPTDLNKAKDAIEELIPCLLYTSENLFIRNLNMVLYEHITKAVIVGVIAF